MRKTIKYLCALVLVAAAALFIFPIRKSDYLLFDELLKSSNPETHSPLLSYSQQKREGVCKQIWYQDDGPLYFRINSEESELFFFRQSNRVEVVEQLGKVTCLMQEELYYENDKPMQRVRYLEAERAIYNYNSHLFVAEDAKLTKYQLEGHTPPTEIKHVNPLMRMKAQSVEFSLKGEKLNFIAHQMKATVNSKERSL
jgi:hypothetical protein